MQSRIEKDYLGEIKIPQESYLGIHTTRAIHNFPISGYKIDNIFIKTLSMVKKAAAETNLELGYLKKNKAEAIIDACNEIIAGKLNDQFPLDVFQGGAGTSTNMNINEVIANRALTLLGEQKGNYTIIDPIEDVNLHQSTNDVYPSALKIAVIYQLQSLSKEIANLQDAFQKKETEFADIIKMGRSQLQDAVPMTLGREFSSFAESISRDRWRTFKCEERLRVLNIGGTAIGTGLSAPRDYIFLIIEKLREITKLGISRADNAVDQTSNMDSFVEVSGILKAHAANLIKISNDLRLLHFKQEINLAKVQVGSSLMPGKINPVILEATISTALKVMANDFLITEAVSRGSLQINEFMPLLSFSILETLTILININQILAKHVSQISANENICNSYVINSPSLITAFVPHIGYKKASELLKEFTNSKDKTIKDFLKNQLGESLVNQVLAPANLNSLGYKKDK